MFEGINLSVLTERGLVFLAVLMLFFGVLVPRSTYKEKCEESERWRKAYEAEREARSLSDGQTKELLEFAKASYHILDAAFSETEQSNRTGGAHRVVPTSR